jgi:uroporphyrin-III C-methyltransferase
MSRRAGELLASADVVVVDGLVERDLLSLVNPLARVVDVSKRPWGRGPSSSQSAINDLLVDLGRCVESVVRLKGGDPFLFGRGGEELEALRAAGIAAEVVPGVSSALGLPALAGVPVTHRGLASSVTIVSGHDVSALAVDALVELGGTIVVLMGVENRSQIASRFVSAGLAPDTPVLVVESGATNRERRMRTELCALGDAPVASPAVIVIGDVVRLADEQVPDARDPLGPANAGATAVAVAAEDGRAVRGR